MFFIYFVLKNCTIFDIQEYFNITLYIALLKISFEYQISASENLVVLS